MEEVWKEFLPGYQISTQGRVKSFIRKEPRLLKTSLTSWGYLHITVKINGKHCGLGVHRLVAQAFIPNPKNKPEVNHINGIKTDNRVENLEWVTRKENMQHAVATGLKVAPQCEDAAKAKLTAAQVKFIRENPNNATIAELAEKFNVSAQAISLIQRGLTWKSLGGTIRQHRPPAKKKLDDSIRKEIRRLYVKGSRKFGLAYFAEKYGLSTQAIWFIVNEK